MDVSSFIAIGILSCVFVTFVAICFILCACFCCCVGWCGGYSFNLSSFYLFIRSRSYFRGESYLHSIFEAIVGDEYYMSSMKKSVDHISGNTVGQFLLLIMFFAIPLIIEVICLCPFPLLNLVFFIPLSCIIVFLIRYFSRRNRDRTYDFRTRMRKEKKVRLLDDQDYIEDDSVKMLEETDSIPFEEDKKWSDPSDSRDVKGYSQLSEENDNESDLNDLNNLIIDATKKKKKKKKNSKPEEIPINHSQIVNEFLSLEKEFASIPISEYSIALANRQKNRYTDILPYNKSLVTIKKSSSKEEGGNEEYINASFITVNDVPYISAQYPINDSYRDINTENEWWSMIFQENVKVVVCLQNPRPPNHPYYFPQKRSEIKYTKKWAIMNESNVVTKNIREMKCLLCDRKQMKKYLKQQKKKMKREKKKKKNENDEVTNNVTIKTSPSRNLLDDEKKRKSMRSVTVILYKAWPDHGLPKTMSSLKKLIDRVDRNNLQEVDGEEKNKKNDILDESGSSSSRSVEETPILVHCSAGVGRSGVFILVHSILRSWKGQDAIQEVQETLRKMRQQRNQMVQNLDQYEYCYRVIWNMLNQ